MEQQNRIDGKEIKCDFCLIYVYKLIIVKKEIKIFVLRLEIQKYMYKHLSMEYLMVNISLKSQNIVVFRSFLTSMRFPDLATQNQTDADIPDHSPHKVI